MSDKSLHYSRQFIDDDDIAEVVRVLKGDYLTTGPEISRFEAALAGIVGAKYAIVCNSGTAALHLAALALDIGPGKTLLTSPITFVATANASRFCGGDVVLSDITPGTGNIDPDKIEELIKARRSKSEVVSALFPVHISGFPADMEKIYSIGQKYNIPIVEDASHALGSRYVTSKGEEVIVGSCKHSLMTVFSFHPVKPITTGEGGAITTNDEKVYKRLLRLRAHGIERDPDLWEQKESGTDKFGNLNPWYYEMQELGWNYRISDFQCALGSSQLKKLDKFVRARNDIASTYLESLSKSKISSFIKPLGPNIKGTSAYHIFVALIDFEKLKVTRAQLMVELKKRNIGSQVNYIPVHHQPYYKKYFGSSGPKLPVADSYYEKAISLPIFYGMTKQDVDHVVNTLEILTS